MDATQSFGVKVKLICKWGRVKRFHYFIKLPFLSWAVEMYVYRYVYCMYLKTGLFYYLSLFIWLNFFTIEIIIYKTIDLQIFVYMLHL